MDIKKCNKCDTEKLRSDFYKASKEPDGLMYTCKTCIQAKDKDRRLANPEYEKARHAKYSKENREKLTIKMRMWRENNPEKVKETTKRGYLKNKEIENERSREYYNAHKKEISARAKSYKLDNKEHLKRYNTEYVDKNRSKINARNKRNVAEKLKATVKWADLDKIREIYIECARLSKETGITHHVDHIVPLRSKHVCGLHVEHNLQILTGAENLLKSNTFQPG
jgi:hypothetical protein